MKSDYKQSLIDDVNKLNSKFDKFIENYVADISIVERTGYFQDFLSIVEQYEGSIVFCGDGRYNGYDFIRDFTMNVNGISIKAQLRLELSGTRFAISKYNSCVLVQKDEIKKVFDKIDENSYWPNGYKVGEYQPGGHDYYVTGALKRRKPAATAMYDGKTIIIAKDKAELAEKAYGKPPYVVCVKGKRIKNNAFIYCNDIDTLILQNTEKIGYLAFHGCENLKKVTFESPCLREIGDQCFEKCYSLEEIEIPDSVSTIGYTAFRYCSELKRISVKSKDLLSEASVPEDTIVVERG